MYDSPRQYGVRDAGVHARTKSAEIHEGTPQDFLRRHERDAKNAVHGNSPMKQAFMERLFARTVDPRNLMCAWQAVAAKSGETPGVDQMRTSDMDVPVVWGLLRTVSNAIRNGTYRVQADRELEIPKTSGIGYRTIRIPTVIDRTVQRAIVQTLQPYLDPRFSDDSFGYRPGRTREQALARAEQLAMGADRWVWITEDIKDAFNQVPQRRLLQVLSKYIDNQPMLKLLETVVVTKEGRGERQGGNLSPLLLNVYLDHFLDQPWRKHQKHTPLIRLADDLLLLSRNREEASEAYERLQQFLKPAGMPLKGNIKTALRDLQEGQDAHWLGYRVLRGTSGLRVQIGEKSWSSLNLSLSEAHGEPASPLRANEAIRGWLSQMGPCYSKPVLGLTYTRIKKLANDLAFDEIPSRQEIEYIWSDAAARWGKLRVKAGSQSEDQMAAPPSRDRR